MTDGTTPTRNRGDHDQAQRGFTLIEIAVAVCVLILALMGLAFAMVSAWRLERASVERKIAITWATAQLEAVRALGVGGCMGDPPSGSNT